MSTPVNRPASPNVSVFYLPHNGFTYYAPEGFFTDDIDSEFVPEGDPLPIHPQKVYDLNSVFLAPAELGKEGWFYTKVADTFKGWTNPFSFDCGEKNEFSLPLIDKADELNLKLAYHLAGLVSNHYVSKVASNSWRALCQEGAPSDFRYSITFRPLCLMSRKVHENLLSDWKEISGLIHEVDLNLNETIRNNTIPITNTDPLYSSMDLRRVIGVNLQSEALSRAKSQRHLLKYFLLAVQHQQQISINTLQEGLVNDFFPPETSPDIWFTPFSQAVSLTDDDDNGEFVIVKPHPLAPPKEQDVSLIPFTEIFPNRILLCKEGWEKTPVSDSFHGWMSAVRMDCEFKDPYGLALITPYEDLIYRLEVYLREIVATRWLAKVMLEALRQITADYGSPGVRVPTYPCTEPFRILFLLARKTHQNCVAAYKTLKEEADRVLMDTVEGGNEGVEAKAR
jgi:hypothetical protein